MQDEQYLARLRTHWKRQAAFPPMAKLTEIVGLTSTSSVHAMVERLCAAGWSGDSDTDAPGFCPSAPLNLFVFRGHASAAWAEPCPNGHHENHFSGHRRRSPSP